MLYVYEYSEYIRIHNSPTAYPDVQTHDIHEDWQFVLLASDGIWDVMTNDDVVRICLRKIEMGIPPETICEELMNECLSPDLLMAGTDNMTVVLICFLHNKPFEELSKRAKEINEREQMKADEMLNAFNDSYPATSADSSEALARGEEADEAEDVDIHINDSGDAENTTNDEDHERMFNAVDEPAVTADGKNTTSPPANGDSAQDLKEH